MALIEIRDFTSSYPLTEKPVLKKINLTVEEGEFVAILGPNGAGKSSLCYAISGFLKHFFKAEHQGKVIVAGQDLEDSDISSWVRNVGLVFQNPFTQLSGSKFSVYEEIAFGLENFGVPREEMPSRIETALQRFGIEELKERSPYSLSGGQQQRVALASIFVLAPKILVLDEPTSQLDPIGTREVFNTIKNLSSAGMTILMAEHKIEWVAEYADRVIVLQEGEIVLQGKPYDALVDERLEKIGVHTTRYTSVARKACDLGIWPAGRPLPVTLREAAAGFREARGGH